MSLLQVPCGKSRAHTLCLCHVGRGKGGCRSGRGRSTHSWQDCLTHAPAWINMDAYQVIHHTGDKDEGARWAWGAWPQWRPVEIASGPAPAVLRLRRTWMSASTGGGIFLFLPWLAQLVSLPNGRVSADGRPSEGMTEESYATLSWNQLSAKFKAEKRFRGRCVGSREIYLRLVKRLE